MMLLSFALAFIGFIALSLSMKRHHTQMWQHKKLTDRQVLWWRFVGYFSLIGSGILCMLSQGVVIGVVLWLGVLSAGALLQTMMLSHWPQLIVRLGIVFFVTGVLATI